MKAKRGKSKHTLSSKLALLKQIYMTPIKFVQYKFEFSEEYWMGPDVLDFVFKKIFTDQKYKGN